MSKRRPRNVAAAHEQRVALLVDERVDQRDQQRQRHRQPARRARSSAPTPAASARADHAGQHGQQHQRVLVDRAHQRERGAQRGGGPGARGVQRARPRPVDGDQASLPPPAGSFSAPDGGDRHGERVAQGGRVERGRRGVHRLARCRRSPPTPARRRAGAARPPARRPCRRRAPSRPRSSSSVRLAARASKRANTPLRLGRPLERAHAAAARAPAPTAATTTRITFCVPLAPSEEPVAGTPASRSARFTVRARLDRRPPHSTRTGPALALDAVQERLGERAHDGRHVGRAAPVAVVPLHHVAGRELVLGGAHVGLDAVHEVEPVHRAAGRRRPRARRSTARSARRSGSSRRCRACSEPHHGARPRAASPAEPLDSSSRPKSRVTRSCAPSPPASRRPRPARSPPSSDSASRSGQPAHQRTVTRSPKEGTRPRLLARAARTRPAPATASRVPSASGDRAGAAGGHRARPPPPRRGRRRRSRARAPPRRRRRTGVAVSVQRALEAALARAAVEPRDPAARVVSRPRPNGPDGSAAPAVASLRPTLYTQPSWPRLRSPRIERTNSWPASPARREHEPKSFSPMLPRPRAHERGQRGGAAGRAAAPAHLHRHRRAPAPASPSPPPLLNATSWRTTGPLGGGGRGARQGPAARQRQTCGQRSPHGSGATASSSTGLRPSVLTLSVWRPGRSRREVNSTLLNRGRPRSETTRACRPRSRFTRPPVWQPAAQQRHPPPRKRNARPRALAGRADHRAPPRALAAQALPARGFAGSARSRSSTGIEITPLSSDALLVARSNAVTRKRYEPPGSPRKCARVSCVRAMNGRKTSALEFTPAPVSSATSTE